MNTTVPTLAQISGDNWRTDSGALRDGLDQVSSNISSAFHTEHNADNTHSTIHASGSISERKRTTPMGEWINVPFNTTDFSVAGAGNSWVPATVAPGATFFAISYTLIGKTMWLNLAVPNAALTIATATNAIFVHVPPGFRVAGVSSAGTYIGRTHVGACMILSATVPFLDTGVMQAFAGATTISIQKVGGATFATDAAFTIEGQMFFEVETV